MEPAEQIRSFIAIELPEEVKDCLKRLQDRLKSVDPSCAKWVGPEGIHLTLKFLGNVNTYNLDAIIKAMQESVKGISPFQLQLKGVGAFPNLRRVQIVWVGLAGDLEQLKTLQSALESSLVSLGFPKENRGFTPHLTLARLRDTATLQQRQTIGDIIAKAEIESNLLIKVESLSLMRSQLTRSGAIYSCLSSVHL
jgi:2'-5' RNA ligase